MVDGKITNLDSQTQYPDIKPVETSIGDIYPARGVIVEEDGTVTLTAYPVVSNTQRTVTASRNCQANYQKSQVE